MSVSDGILRAAERWLQLLRRSSLQQAWALIRSRAEYTDLTPTQYASGLEWLQSTGLVKASGGGVVIAPAALGLPDGQLRQVLFAEGLRDRGPAWLTDADILVPDVTALPEDAIHIAQVLGLDERTAWLTVQQVHGHIDLEERARVGAAGELALIGLLERTWPGSTMHVALKSDGFGYDIVLQLPATEWHLEVKSTTRRGRLLVHMSRHEHEVGITDPSWRMVVVGLDEGGQAAALATVTNHILRERAPDDRHLASSWESVRHELAPDDLQPGLSFLPYPDGARYGPLLCRGVDDGAPPFAWMPPSPNAGA